MTKVSISDLRDPQKKISVAPLTKEQHEKLVKVVGYGGDWIKNFYYRFFPNQYGTFSHCMNSYMLFEDASRSLREVTFDEIDFGERKLLHYLSNSIKDWCLPNNCQWVKDPDSYYYTTAGGLYCLPASLVEAYFTPVYEKTVHIAEGDYTEQELMEYLKQVK